MIMASCHVQGAGLQADLGQAETIITQLGFPPRDDGDTPYATRVFARWRLTQAGVEHLERVRDGGNLVAFVTPDVVLLNHGESPPGLHPTAAATCSRAGSAGAWASHERVRRATCCRMATCRGTSG
jgi:hypothetical protein